MQRLSCRFKNSITYSKAFDLSISLLGFDIKDVIEEVGNKIAEKLKKDNYKKVLFLIGPGNNGCDGLATIKNLNTTNVDVYLYKKGANFSELNKKYLKELKKIVRLVDLNEIKDKDYDCVVEAFFGTGFKSDLEYEAKKVIALCNKKKARKIAIDIPIKSFKAEKVYSILTKKTENAELIELNLHQKIKHKYVSALDLLDIKTFENERKGLNGKILIIAGSAKYLGSLYFSCYCASMFCDLVYYYCPEQQRNMSNEIPEAIPLAQEELKQKLLSDYFDSILIGPGITADKKDELKELLEICLKKKTKLILDAYGIDLIKDKKLNNNVLLTPHKGEFKRVFEKEPNLKNLIFSSKEKNCNILLKGKVDLLVTPESKVYKNILGNNGLTKGGTGDTLAGLITALASQNNLISSTKAGLLLLTHTADILEKEMGKNYSVRILIEKIPKVYYDLIRKIYG
ncbi:MAG: NAD(P)H-hydrate dehydratase [Candidatus Micrarchaeota archaeon]|nr:NAD(P)H-hydrate dehydratase [Candidatus Micrarchaeota archaeon]